MMQPVHHVLANTLDQLAERRRQFRVRQIERWGFDPECDCAECGDVGTLPDRHGKPCPSCEAGRDLAARMRRGVDWLTLCPRRFREFRLESHPNRRAVQEVEAWLEEGMPTGRNLLLAGDVGTGKTGLAIAALRECFITGRTVKVGTVPDLMQAMRPRDLGRVPEEDISIRDLQRVQVLLLDDLGAEKSTEWQLQQLFLIINGRYERGRPTIVTTNRNDLDERLGERAMSRFSEDLTAIAMLGEDLRQRSAQARAHICP